MNKTNANICTLMALFFIFFGFNQFFTAFSSRHWEKASGVITESFVNSASARGGPINYYVDVRYIFMVDSQRYQGDTLLLDVPEHLNRASALEQLKSYPIQKFVDVFYDPKDPSNSALHISESPLGHIYLIFIGGAFLLLRIKYGPK